MEREKTQYRLDHSALRKCYKSPEGYLYAEATFARDGILEYTRADGTKRRELRLPEENKKALTGFGRKPFTIEHPTVLVNADNSKQLSVGMTDPEVVYDKSGFVRGVITVMDSEAVDLITSNQKPEVSVGYQCRLDHTPGVWNGQPYDAIQREIVVNHVCCTSKGRAGQDVRIHLDSEEADRVEIAYLVDSLDTTPTTGGKVADLTIGQATFKDLPTEVVTAMSSELRRMDSVNDDFKQIREDNASLKTQLEEAQARIDSLAEELADAVDRADTQEGRADRLEEILEESTELLTSEGYKWDSDDSVFVREDMGMKKVDMEEEEDDEEDEEMPEEMKGKKKDGYMKKDSVEDIVAAVLEAEEICPGIRQDSDLSSLSVREIQEAVISRLDSEIDLSEASDGYVAGVYWGLTEGRQDSTTVESNGYSHAEQAMQQVSNAGAARNDSYEGYEGESSARMAAAWQQPLS